MFAQLNRLLRRLAIALEVIVGLIFSLPRRLLFWRRKPVEVKIFNAVRHPGGLHIRGRSLAEKKLQPPRADDGHWVNFKRTLSQFITAEAPRAQIEIRLGDKVHRLHSNREGYFQLETGPTTEDRLTIHLPKSGWSRGYRLTGSHQTSDFLVITDIDDTLIETGATALRTMIATTVFGNALTRKLVQGTPELIRHLSDRHACPVFALTSSPWNLESFLKAMFQRMQLRTDAIFMTDWGLTVDQWIHPDHDQHKLHAIRRILRWHPKAQAVLFGDDSQLDPEVYAQVAEEFPERVAAILIRPVSGKSRLEEVERLLTNHKKLRHSCRPEHFETLLKELLAKPKLS